MTKKLIIAIMVIIVCLIPVFTVVFVSNKEIDKFKVSNEYELREKAYGEIVSPTREEIKEYYNVDGEIISDSVRFMKIPICNYENIRWLVELEQEVSTGEKIGFCGDTNIYSSCDGIIKEIDTAREEPFIKAQTFDKLVFKAVMPLEKADKMKDTMYDKKGNKFCLIKKSRQYTDEGITVLYKIDNASDYRYGQKMSEFKLYTGEVYSDVLVLPKSCVYKGFDDKMYVRLCDNAGYYIREQEVNVGFEINNLISVTGIKESDYCDSGYSYAKNNEDIPNDIEFQESIDEQDIE